MYECIYRDVESNRQELWLATVLTKNYGTSANILCRLLSRSGCGWKWFAPTSVNSMCLDTSASFMFIVRVVQDSSSCPVLFIKFWVIYVMIWVTSKGLVKFLSWMFKVTLLELFYGIFDRLLVGESHFRVDDNHLYILFLPLLRECFTFVRHKRDNKLPATFTLFRPYSVSFSVSI